LDFIQEEYNRKYGKLKLKSTKGYELNGYFQKYLERAAVEYSVNSVDKTELALSGMNNLKNNIQDNIQSLLKRDDKLDAMIERTDELGSLANSMKTRVLSSLTIECSDQEEDILEELWYKIIRGYSSPCSNLHNPSIYVWV